MPFLKGHKNPNAGRPKGSKTLISVRDYFNAKDIKELMDSLREAAKTDNKVKMFLVDHLAGKAAQSMDVTSGGEKLTTSADLILALQNDRRSRENTPAV